MQLRSSFFPLPPLSVFPRNPKWGWFIAQHAEHTQITHSNCNRLGGGEEGVVVQVEGRKSRMVRACLSATVKCPPTYTGELSCCIRLILWWIMHTFYLCSLHEWVGQGLSWEQKWVSVATRWRHLVHEAAVKQPPNFSLQIFLLFQISFVGFWNNKMVLALNENCFHWSPLGQTAADVRH